MVSKLRLIVPDAKQDMTHRKDLLIITPMKFQSERLRLMVLKYELETKQNISLTQHNLVDTLLRKVICLPIKNLRRNEQGN